MKKIKEEIAALEGFLDALFNSLDDVEPTLMQLGHALDVVEHYLTRMKESLE